MEEAHALLQLSSFGYAWLMLAALLAGFVDSIAGGGGVISLPALLAFGFPPHLALGTNKGQAVFGSGAAFYRFLRAGLVDKARARLAFPASFLGSLLGAILVLFISPAALRPVVLVLLFGVALFFVVRPGQGQARATLKPELRSIAAIAIAILIGTYDGFFGPGTGTFLIFAYVYFFGSDLRHASADAKIVNFASNLAAVLLFASRGLVVWKVALPMAAAQLLGSSLGAQVAVKGGERIIRVVVLGVVLVLIGKLGWELV